MVELVSKRLNVTISQDAMELIKELAVKENRSLSNMVDTVIKTYYQQHK